VQKNGVSWVWEGVGERGAAIPGCRVEGAAKAIFYFKKNIDFVRTTHFKLFSQIK
jgi:hypothetical protein